jgi:hypothetical protein
MGRKINSGFGKPQKIEEPIKETKIESEPIIADLKTEAPTEPCACDEPCVEPCSCEKDVVVTVQEEIVNNLDENFGIVAEDEIKEAVSEALQISTEKIEVVVAPKRPLESLSPSEFKTFQRTGIMPR